ncbi:Rieske 2Fe-2S domain-containing protein [Sphingomonas histidinilytica]|uniref:non-heme iron oxygenase ferredoxin subunit n=1 Tax=Rhizorhabdus histidinilytica TaxID=439228 RepID=UPI001ADC32CB|nr:non-heme iron oxygenase ferredoxin subunit [Rhizorhabdus histidinilytica]MBO9380471.1 Rieske 2Fe-2S domain-containing protein [Rhizorhabdus histidinilytica]
MSISADDAASWHPITRSELIHEGDIFAGTFQGREIAVYNVNGTLYATSNICTHAFALLSDGWLEDFVVECPLHNARFDVRDGAALASPAEGALQCFPVRVNDGVVEVRL